MDKITFLNELEYQLHKLPGHKIDDIMNSYENYFYEEGLKGYADSEIVHSLDTPKQIAKQKYAQYALNNAETKPDVSHIVRAVIATIGVSIVTFCFVLIPLVIVSPFILAFAFASLGMILSPLIVFIWNIWAGLHHFSVSNYLFSFAYFGLGTMFLVVVVKLLIGIRNWLIRYLKWNMNFIKKGTM
ncbi:DUF1700 domain-containing protein [Staphylococcus sp. 17KM0847]|uniref:DUF1700 domain-containing protein n=1 Tax=Staphylococcus sp. 17KM0847 TaxID=2583989 RepID=UPI0015DC6A59|nr:DUF1700 domain-containing protein [Staphylococcus sp. 17KM0847]QLK86435.1 DUF1700 domain-containing protein [Staphylococcus sp. 17KM0847]